MVVCDLSVVEAQYGTWIHRRSGTEPVEQDVEALLDCSSKANALSRSAAAEVGDVCGLCSAIHRISGPAAPNTFPPADVRRQVHRRVGVQLRHDQLNDPVLRAPTSVTLALDRRQRLGTRL